MKEFFFLNLPIKNYMPHLKGKPIKLIGGFQNNSAQMFLGWTSTENVQKDFDQLKNMAAVGRGLFLAYLIKRIFLDVYLKKISSDIKKASHLSKSILKEILKRHFRKISADGKKCKITQLGSLPVSSDSGVSSDTSIFLS